MVCFMKRHYKKRTGDIPPNSVAGHSQLSCQEADIQKVCEGSIAETVRSFSDAVLGTMSCPRGHAPTDDCFLPKKRVVGL